MMAFILAYWWLWLIGLAVGLVMFGYMAAEAISNMGWPGVGIDLLLRTVGLIVLIIGGTSFLALLLILWRMFNRWVTS